MTAAAATIQHPATQTEPAKSGSLFAVRVYKQRDQRRAARGGGGGASMNAAMNLSRASKFARLTLLDAALTFSRPESFPERKRASLRRSFEARSKRERTFCVWNLSAHSRRFLAAARRDQNQTQRQREPNETRRAEVKWASERASEKTPNGFQFINSIEEESSQTTGRHSLESASLNWPPLNQAGPASDATLSGI